MDGTGPRQRTGGVSFRIDRNQIRKNSDGSIDVPGYLTKTGVFEYRRGDATVRELRSDAEVFSERSLDSLRSVLVTKDHPPEFLTTDNWKEHAIGHVSHVSADPPYVSGKLRVHDAAAIHMIEQGYLKEVSCGYACVPKAANREDADIEQTELEYNHVAIGPEGWSRMGTALRLDNNDNEVVERFDTQETLDMTELKEALAPMVEALAAITGRLDAIEAHKAEPEKTEDSPIKKHVELPDAEKVEAIVKERVDAMLSLELQARDAYAAYFPSDYIEPVLCGRKLCEAVLQTVDHGRIIKDNDALEPLVREAQLLAKKERQDALAQKPTVSSIQQQLTGVRAHILQTPKSAIRAHIFGTNEG